MKFQIMTSASITGQAKIVKKTVQHHIVHVASNRRNSIIFFHDFNHEFQKTGEVAIIYGKIPARSLSLRTLMEIRED